MNSILFAIVRFLATDYNEKLSKMATAVIAAANGVVDAKQLAPFCETPPDYHIHGDLHSLREQLSSPSGNTTRLSILNY